MKLVSKAIFEDMSEGSTEEQNSQLCVFQRYTSSLNLFFGDCTDGKSQSFSYHSSDPQMLSYRWAGPNLCLSASLEEGLVMFQTCDVDDFSQKWIFGGDDDTFVRWQMDDSLCIGANGETEFANAILVQCDSLINYNEDGWYVPYTPVSFDF